MDEKQVKKIVNQEILNYMRTKQYNISKIPIHEHTGVDTVKISEKNIIHNNKFTAFIISSTEGELSIINNIPNVNTVSFYGFVANNVNTGTVSMQNGSTTVTGTGTQFSSAMVGLTIIFPSITVGRNSYIVASYTSPTQIDLTDVFETADIGPIAFTIQATKRAIITGKAEIGNCFGTNGINYYPVNIIQACNYMYQNTSSVTTNRVGASNGAADFSESYIAYATEGSVSTTICKLVVSYQNNSLIFTTLKLANQYQLQGAIIIT